MQIIRFLLAMLGCAALVPGLGLAEPANPAAEPAPSESQSNSTIDRPSDEGHGANSYGKGGRTDGKHPDPAPSEPGSKSTSERPPGTGRGAQVRGEGERTDGRHPDGPPHTSHQVGQASAGKAPPRSRSGQEGIKPATSGPEHSGEKRAASDQTRSTSSNVTGPHKLGLNQAAGAANDGLMRDTIAKQRSQAVQLPVLRPSTAWPLNTAPWHGSVPAAIGGTTSASAAKNTAVINGTAMKHRP